MDTDKPSAVGGSSDLDKGLRLYSWHDAAILATASLAAARFAQFGVMPFADVANTFGEPSATESSVAADVGPQPVAPNARARDEPGYSGGESVSFVAKRCARAAAGQPVDRAVRRPYCVAMTSQSTSPTI